MNTHDCSEYSLQSFVSRLHEEAHWDHDAYRMLTAALAEISRRDERCPEVVWRVVRIFSWLFGIFVAHVDPGDGFNIQNLNEEEFHDIKEDAQLAFEAFFKPVGS